MDLKLRIKNSQSSALKRDSNFIGKYRIRFSNINFLNIENLSSTYYIKYVRFFDYVWATYIH